MTRKRPEFKPHDEFIFEHKKIGKVTREEFIKYIRNSHDHMRKLSEIIQQYNQTIDDYLNEWDGNFESFDDDVKDLLGRWINDGTMDHIINENLMSIKANKEYVDELHDTTTTQLAQKATKDEVNSKRDKTVPIGLNDTDSELLSAIQGGEGTTFSLESIPRDYSVHERKTTFIQLSSNLFNKKDVNTGKKIEAFSGNLIDDSSFSTSNLINISKNTDYTTTGVTRIAFYTDSGAFISSDLMDGTFTTPANAYYIRLQCENDDLNIAQLNEGNVLLPYEEYNAELKNISVPGEMINNLKITPNQTNFITMSSNLFNKKDKNVLIDSTVNNDTGTIEHQGNFNVSHFITVEPGLTYSLNFGSKYAVYDKDKNWLRNKYYEQVPLPTSITLGNDVYFIRIAYNYKTDVEDKMINKGDTLLPFEEHYTSINGVKFSQDGIQNEINELEEIKTYDKFIIDGVTDGVYTSPEIPQYPKNLILVTAEEIYAMFDELVTNYPDYVSRTLLGRDSSDTHDIYRYDFKPTEVPTVGLGEKNAKMIILGGIHGQEKIPPLIIYHTMKQICENWKTEPVLDTLRWNAHLIIVPVVNPYGYSITSKPNANGVNLSRNFPTDWSTSATDPGPYPLSEVETQYIDNILNENKEDTVFFTSYHNFIAGDGVSNVFIWQAAATSLQLHIAKKLISKLSRKWKKQYTWLPQDETTYFGYADFGAPVGSEGRHANSYGIHGSTFETSREFKLEETPIRDGTIPLTLGTETFVNFLLLGLKHGVDYRNNHAE